MRPGIKECRDWMHLRDEFRSSKNEGRTHIEPGLRDIVVSKSSMVKDKKDWRVACLTDEEGLSWNLFHNFDACFLLRQHAKVCWDGKQRCEPFCYSSNFVLNIFADDYET